MHNKHYIGEIGTVILVDCGCDISSSTVHELKIKKPSGTEVSWNAEVVDKNFLKYTINKDDFNEKGIYYLQSYLEFNNGWKGLGETVIFYVCDKWER